jgi:hypothetical protein
VTDKVPLTLEELALIGSFGQKKVADHGKHIIATIWAFLVEHNLLFLFPGVSAEGPPYEIKECPTWRNPASAEADAVRAIEGRAEEMKNTAVTAATAATVSSASSSVGVLEGASKPAADEGKPLHVFSVR